MDNCCIIVPCYNEENRIELERFADFIQSNGNFHFLFVNDGSKDNTLLKLKSYTEGNPKMEVLDLAQNVGKAEAIRIGLSKMAHKNYKLIGFLDADLATPLEELPKFIEKMKGDDHLVITGARIMRLGTDIARKWYRHYIGRVFATLASMSLKLAVYDTQCGAKVFRADVVEEIFKEKFLSKWLFDIELLFRLKKTKQYGECNFPVYELPLSKWDDKHGSKLKLRDFIKAPYELLRIHFKYNQK